MQAGQPMSRRLPCCLSVNVKLIFFDQPFSVIGHAFFCELTIFLFKFGVRIG